MGLEKVRQTQIIPDVVKIQTKGFDIKLIVPINIALGCYKEVSKSQKDLILCMTFENKSRLFSHP